MTDKPNSYTEQGAIQLVSSEIFVLKNQSYVNFKVERLNSLKGDTGVSLKVFYGSKVLTKLSGRVQFFNENIQQIVKVHLNNSSREKPTRIELFNPTNIYKLGINKVANISFVGKFNIDFFFYTCINIISSN